VLLLTFAKRHREIYGPIDSVDPELAAFLRTQPLAGNVRELENMVQRMLFGKTCGATLELADWLAVQSADDRPGDYEDPLGDAAQTLWEAISQRRLTFAQALRQIEKKVIEAALQAGGRTRREIAMRLRTSERTLYHKIRAHQLSERSSPQKINARQAVP